MTHYDVLGAYMPELRTLNIISRKILYQAVESLVRSYAYSITRRK